MDFNIKNFRGLDALKRTELKLNEDGKLDTVKNDKPLLSEVALDKVELKTKAGEIKEIIAKSVHNKNDENEENNLISTLKNLDYDVDISDLDVPENIMNSHLLSMLNDPSLRHRQERLLDSVKEQLKTKLQDMLSAQGVKADAFDDVFEKVYDDVSHKVRCASFSEQLENNLNTKEGILKYALQLLKEGISEEINKTLPYENIQGSDFNVNIEDIDASQVMLGNDDIDIIKLEHLLYTDYRETMSDKGLDPNALSSKYRAVIREVRRELGIFSLFTANIKNDVSLDKIIQLYNEIITKKMDEAIAEQESSFQERFK